MSVLLEPSRQRAEPGSALHLCLLSDSVRKFLTALPQIDGARAQHGAELLLALHWKDRDRRI
jgi:hypothetical protein